jgi:hypothetical protein
MAGPLSGIGGQPQVTQAAQSQSASQNNQGVRQQEEQRETRPNEVQPQGAPVNENQDANNTNQNRVSQEEFVASNDAEFDPSTPRGSLVDIAV